jgi:uncharacterized phage-associated protein
MLKPYSGYQLEAFTHNEEPWVNARKGISSGERSTNIITKSSMRAFYKKEQGL